MNSTYDKNDLNGTKGSIGELIVALWLMLNNRHGVIRPVRKANKPEQDVGIDLIIESPVFPHPQTIDTKLSDSKNSHLSITYRNSTGKRHPYRFNTKSHYVYVVDFDYPAYSNKQKNSLKDETLETMKERLSKHLDITSIKLPKRVSMNSEEQLELDYLKDLYIGIRTRERLDTLLAQLQIQANDIDLQDYSNLLLYLRAIYFIQTLSLQNLAKKTRDGKEKVSLDGKNIPFSQLAQRTEQSYFQQNRDRYHNSYKVHMVPKCEFEILYQQDNNQSLHFNIDSFNQYVSSAVNKVRSYPSKFQSAEDGKLRAKFIATARDILGVQKQDGLSISQSLITNFPRGVIEKIIDLKSEYIEESDKRIKDRLTASNISFADIEGSTRA